jgi:hypothetical protein
MESMTQSVEVLVSEIAAAILLSASPPVQSCCTSYSTDTRARVQSLPSLRK